MFVWLSYPGHKSGHFRIRLQQTRKHRHQRIVACSFAGVGKEVEYADEFAVRSAIRDQCFATFVPDPDRFWQGVVSMAAQNCRQTFDATGEFQIDIDTVMREQHDGRHPEPANLAYGFTQRLLVNTESPVGNQVLTIGDRRVRGGLPDDRHLHAADLPDDEPEGTETVLIV